MISPPEALPEKRRDLTGRQVPHRHVPERGMQEMPVFADGELARDGRLAPHVNQDDVPGLNRRLVRGRW